MSTVDEKTQRREQTQWKQLWIELQEPTEGGSNKGANTLGYGIAGFTGSTVSSQDSDYATFCGPTVLSRDTELREENHA